MRKGKGEVVFDVGWALPFRDRKADYFPTLQLLISCGALNSDIPTPHTPHPTPL